MDRLLAHFRPYRTHILRASAVALVLVPALFFTHQLKEQAADSVREEGLYVGLAAGECVPEAIIPPLLRASILAGGPEDEEIVSSVSRSDLAESASDSFAWNLRAEMDKRQFWRAAGEPCDEGRRAAIVTRPPQTYQDAVDAYTVGCLSSDTDPESRRLTFLDFSGDFDISTAGLELACEHEARAERAFLAVLLGGLMAVGLSVVRRGPLA